MKKLISLVLTGMILCSAGTVFADDPLSDLSAKSLLLMEADTGEILYERNPDEKLPIASVTKIMTMLLVMEAIDSGKITFDETVTASERAKSMGGSTMFLETGEQLPVHDMLKGIAVASANDGAVAMAEHIAGSEAGFVEMMNLRAAELGMTNTHFVNTNGLDDENHYSTARDVALMSRELLKHPKIFEYTTIWMDSLRDGKFQLANTNKLIRFYQGANGLKTGSTSKAQCCISATALRDGMQLIAVVLGSPNSKSRFGAASGLLDYGFANYGMTTAVNENESFEELPVIKGEYRTVPILSQRASRLLLKKGAAKDTERKFILPESVTAPVTKGEPAGTLEIYQDGVLRDSVPLVYGKSIEKKRFFSFFREIVSKWISCEA